MRTLMWGGIGAFIVVRFCLLSLQRKLFPCRTLPSRIRNVVDKLFIVKSPRSLRCSPNIFPMFCPIHINPLFHQGFHSRDGLDFLLAHGHGPVRPVRPHSPVFIPFRYIYIVTVWIETLLLYVFLFLSFFFFFPTRNSWLCQLWTVHICTVHGPTNYTFQ